MEWFITISVADYLSVSLNISAEKYEPLAACRFISRDTNASENEIEEICLMAMYRDCIRKTGNQFYFACSNLMIRHRYLISFFILQSKILVSS